MKTLYNVLLARASLQLPLFNVRQYLQHVICQRNLPVNTSEFLHRCFSCILAIQKSYEEELRQTTAV